MVVPCRGARHLDSLHGAPAERATRDAPYRSAQTEWRDRAQAGTFPRSRLSPLDAAIIFAAAGDLVSLALKAVRKGGRVVCAGIHMSDIPPFPRALLREERHLVSVADLTRQDGIGFLRLAARIPIQCPNQELSRSQANEALGDLRAGRFDGAAVLVP